MKRALVLLAVSATAVPLLAPGTANAQAAKAPTLQITPSVAVLKAKSSTTVTFRLRVPGLHPESLVSVTARGPKGDFDFAEANDRDKDGVWVATLRFDRLDQPGGWRAETEIYDFATGDDYAGPSGRFALKRGTALTVNGAPEPVKKGRTLSVGGRLTRLTEFGIPADYAAFGGQRVQIQFRRKGATGWVNKGFVTTGRDGKYLKRFKADRDGTWRAVFAGNALHAPVVSGGDYVDVR
ncbi:MAG TPA: hypothetical protein VHJ17_03240 [Thermomonospora sp.]|nr:hypothetical protein [Thermomonospora sp.]